MRTAARAQPVRHAFQHQAHRRGHRAQHGDLGSAHAAGIDVGQQPGAVAHGLRRVGHVVQRAGVAVRGEPVAGCGVASFGPVAEREQRLLAAECRTLARRLERLVERHVGRGQPARRLGESAVMADVAAKMSQRQERLAGIRHASAMARIAQAGGAGRQLFARKGQQFQDFRHVGRVVVCNVHRLILWPVRSVALSRSACAAAAARAWRTGAGSAAGPGPARGTPGGRTPCRRTPPLARPPLPDRR